jgi:glycosyltransferase involved in cell wall biosynthesis
MKVLIVSQYFWPENFRINELATSLHARGVELEVITGKPNYPSGRVFKGYSAWNFFSESFRGVTVHRVPLFPRGNRAIGLAFNYLSFVLAASILGPWLLRGRHFDAIFVFAPSPIFQAIPAIFIGRLKHCPTILWVQDLWPESLVATGYIKYPSFLRVVERIVKSIYCNVDLILVQSKTFILKVRSLADATPIAYYPNSFIENPPSDKYQQINFPGFNHDFPVLFAGNIGSVQAVEVVLEAASILKNDEGICFVMVGDGSRREWLIGEAENRGLKNIVCPGYFSVELMPALMAKAAALLVTLADMEIFRLTIPSKIQAYLAAGRPIIACLNGVGAEIVQEAGAGVTVPAENALALAQAIRKLYALPEKERLDMGARGQAYYDQHFSHDKLVGKLMKYLEQAVSRYKGSTS